MSEEPVDWERIAKWILNLFEKGEMWNNLGSDDYWDYIRYDEKGIPPWVSWEGMCSTCFEVNAGNKCCDD